MSEYLGQLVSRLLGVKRSHLEAIGEVKVRNPWIEDSWRWGGFCLVHWQNLKHPAVSSTSEPRHTWRLYLPHTTLKLIVQYGIAPHV